MTTTLLPTYPVEKLLSMSNAQQWEYYILDQLSAYPIIGKAIRVGARSSRSASLCNSP